MKLIDLLVQELPKRGGWTFGKNAVYQDWDGELRIDSEYNSSTKIFLPLSEIVRERGTMKHSLPDEAFVTREQYDAALKPVWNGEGLPPVGTECEFKYADEEWTEGRITYISNHTILIELKTPDDDGDLEPAFTHDDMRFRPIRTEAECQRDEFLSYCNDKPVNTYAELYDDIAAHKITGVTLVPTVGQIVRVTEKCSREDAERIITMLTGGTITE